VATLTPGDTLPVAPPGGDKLHHVVAFALLVLPLSSVRPSAALWLAPAAAFYGGLIEYVQPFVKRYGDFADFVADLVGILAGVLLGCTIHVIWRMWRKG
jgi:VanZ family protein